MHLYICYDSVLPFVPNGGLVPNCADVSNSPTIIVWGIETSAVDMQYRVR